MSWLFFALTAAFFWGSGSVLGRSAILRMPYNLSLIVFGYSILVFYFIAWILIGSPFPKGNYLIPTISESSATLGYIFYYLALRESTASSVVPITSSYVIISVLIGKIFLNNMVTQRQGIAVVLIIIGAILISMKDLGIKKGRWLYFTLVAVLLWGIWGGLTDISVRIVKPVNLNLFYSIIAVSIWSIFFLITRKSFTYNLNKKSIFLSIGSAFISSIGSIAFYFAIFKSNVTLAIPVSNLYPFFSIMTGIIFLKERMNIIQVIGIPFIISGLFLMG